MVTEDAVREVGAEGFPISLRLPKALKAKAQKLADRRYTTLSEYIRQALVEKVEREEGL
jgi:predicted transcriptional regulator